MTAKDYQQKGMFSIFLSFFKPHRGLFFLDMVCALFSCVANLAFPYATRFSLQSLLPVNKFGAFFAVMGILALAYLISALCNYVITYLGHLMGVRIEADMRTDVLTHIQTLSFSFFDKNARSAHGMDE